MNRYHHKNDTPHRAITICKYGSYQRVRIISDKPTTSDRQAERFNKHTAMAYIKKRKSNRNRQYEMKRKERMRVYNTQRWKEIRDWKRISNPLCEECLKEDRTTPTEEVHHIVSFMTTDDPIKRTHLAFDYENLMSLCKECHQKMHN